MTKNKFVQALNNPEVPYIIAETAYIHEGDFDYLMKLVKEIIKAKCCDAIKFHILIDIDSYITPSHKLYSLYKKMMMSKEKWEKILKFAKSKKFETIVLADDSKAIDFVKENINMVDAVELHAIALNNIVMLQKIKDIKVPIILGIGGSKIEDIKFALAFLKRKDILLMHGFQNYPTKHEYANFRRMAAAMKKFNLPVGYADHTSWDSEYNELITLAGFMAGANFIEKHVTLNFGKKRIDYEASISIDMFREIKEKIKILNKTKGDGLFNIPPYEDIYAKNGPMKFTVVAKKNLKKGGIIKTDCITFKRTGEENNIAQREYLSLIGKTAKRYIPKNHLVNWSNVQN